MDAGDFLDDPLTIHNRTDLLLRGNKAPSLIAKRVTTDTVFTFVRHPIRRAYSCFTEKIVSNGPYSFPKVRDFIAHNYGANFQYSEDLELYQKNFKAFLQFSYDSFKKKNGSRRDPHWCPQTMVLAHIERVRRVDFIGRVEAMQRDLRALFDIANTKLPPLPRMNEGAAPVFSYEDVVDAEIVELATKFLGWDMEYLGYWELQDKYDGPRAQ